MAAIVSIRLTVPDHSVEELKEAVRAFSPGIDEKTIDAADVLSCIFEGWAEISYVVDESHLIDKE